MKKLLTLIIISILFFSSCNKDQSTNELIAENLALREKTIISDKELSDLVINDQDLSIFITEKRNFFNELQDRIGNFSKETKRRFSDLMKKYKSAEDFIVNGSNEENDFYRMAINYNPTTADHLENVIKKLEKYNYSRKFLISIIENNLNPKSNSKSLHKRVASDKCQEYSWYIYFCVYYDRTLFCGWSQSSADNAATIAACWAYVGCVYGSTNN